MPGRLRVLSGAEVVAAFGRHGFVQVSQRGSHVKLARLREGHRQVLVVPLHRELDRGTLVEIYRQGLVFIPAESLRPDFYSDA